MAGLVMDEIWDGGVQVKIIDSFKKILSRKSLLLRSAKCSFSVDYLKKTLFYILIYS